MTPEALVQASSLYGQIDDNTLLALAYTLLDQNPQPNRFVTVHHSKVALANHAWDEPRENERKAAEVSGIPLISCCIGEIVTL